MGLYVEAHIRAGLDEVWERSQRPEQHQRWDLRFSEIDYLPCEPGEPQRFRYATRVLPLLTVDGVGVSAGERSRPDGTRTSALRFSSPRLLSLIEEGQGYWRYVPDGEGLRFFTGYDYRPRWGRFGRAVDRLLFRPLMGWATAWSFDRLRLWCERGITPERSLRHALGELSLRIATVLVTAIVAPLAVLVVAPAALLVPPLPSTPAARRCLRRPPERAGGRGASAAAPPALLATLEQP